MNVIVRGAAMFAGLICAVAGGAPAHAADDDRVVSNAVVAAIAMVAVPQANGYAIGTAWCFWSTPTRSYFLTNEHVVAGASQAPLVRLARDLATERYAMLYRGRLYPRPSAMAATDLAVIVVDVGDVPSLTLEAYFDPAIGTSVGIAGFPSFEFVKAQAEHAQAFPSVHFGHVDSEPYTSAYVEYDATADHGNSGGPLFDASSGLVVGVVDLGIPSATSRAVQNNLAIRSRDVAAYVEAGWLPYYDVLRGARHAVIPCRADAAAGLATIKSSWCGGPDAVR